MLLSILASLLLAPTATLANSNITFPCSTRGYATSNAIPFSITSTFTNLTTCIEICRATKGACKAFSYLSGCGPGQDIEFFSSDVNYIGTGDSGGVDVVGADCSRANTCELYAAPIGPYFRADPESPVRWWNIACFEAPFGGIRGEKGKQSNKSTAKAKTQKARS